MRLMIASDLHGSLTLTEKLFECYEKEKAEKLVLLGDLLYHGARNDLPEGYSTKGLTALLNAHKEDLLCVRGNCDSAVDQMVLEFPIMADYNMMFVDGRTWIVTHGDLIHEEAMIPHTPGTVLLHGHTHLKIAEKIGDFYYLNPGSVSIPKDGDQGSYMIYEDGCFTIKLLDGTVVKELVLD
ncbi:MAG: phosphodiesterase [Lachnospiraceae bacterium]|nr:phosphodiesterase [Lachnospiraceae bacterium]